MPAAARGRFRKRCRSRLHPGCSGLNWVSRIQTGRSGSNSGGSDPIRAGRRRIIYPGLACPGIPLRLPWAPSADPRRARAAAAPAGGQLPVAWWESGRGRFTKGRSPSALLRRPPPNPYCESPLYTERVLNAEQPAGMPMGSTRQAASTAMRSGCDADYLPRSSQGHRWLAWHAFVTKKSRPLHCCCRSPQQHRTGR